MNKILKDQLFISCTNKSLHTPMIRPSFYRFATKEIKVKAYKNYIQKKPKRTNNMETKKVKQ